MKVEIKPALKHVLLTLGFAAAMTGSASAALIALANGDLESTTGNPAADVPVAPNWGGGTQGAGVTRFAAGRTSPEPLGDWFAFTRNQASQSPRFAQQTLATVFLADTVYTLSSLITHNGSADDLVYEIGYLVSSTYTVLGTATFDQNPFTTQWVRTTGASYTTGTTGPEIGEAITIRLRSTGSAGAWFDNVTLDATAVPEPSLAAMAVVSALGLLVASRRRF